MGTNKSILILIWCTATGKYPPLLPPIKTSAPLNVVVVSRQGDIHHEKTRCQCFHWQHDRQARVLQLSFWCDAKASFFEVVVLPRPMRVVLQRSHSLVNVPPHGFVGGQQTVGSYMHISHHTCCCTSRLISAEDIARKLACCYLTATKPNSLQSYTSSFTSSSRLTWSLNQGCASSENSTWWLINQTE